MKNPVHTPQKRFITQTSAKFSSTLKTDYYELLGIQKTASLPEIKVAYIRQAKKFHPDANPDDPDAAGKFQAIAEAFEVLSDEDKRGNYDAFGMDGQGASGEGEKAKKKKKGKGSSVFGDFVDDDEAQDFHDRVFSQFAAEFHEAGIHVDPDVAREYGCSIHGNLPTKEATIELSFFDAVGGCSKKVSLNVVEICPFCNGRGSPFEYGKIPCQECEGKGKGTFINPSSGLPFRGICPKCRGDKFIFLNRCYECEGKGKVLWRKFYSIPVPPGVVDGQKMEVRIWEQDVTMTLLVGDSEQFTRDGADVASDVTISIAQAILGGKKKMDSIYDFVDLDAELPERFIESMTVEIPPGTSSHDVVVVEGRGMKKVDDEEKGYGDHSVHFVIASPSVITERQRTLMEEYAKLETGREGTVNIRAAEEGKNKMGEMKN